MTQETTNTPDIQDPTIMTAFDVTSAAYGDYVNGYMTAPAGSLTAALDVEAQLKAAGWQEVTDSSVAAVEVVDADTFQGVAYYKTINGVTEVIVGDRGSQKLHDFVVSDALLAIGITPKVDQDALNYFEAVKQWATDNSATLGSVQFIETGHSLGGQEADYVDVMEQNGAPSIPLETVTFNAPGLGDNVDIKSNVVYDALNISAYGDFVHVGGGLINQGYAGVSTLVQAGSSLAPAAVAFGIGAATGDPLLMIAGIGSFLYQGLYANHVLGPLRDYLTTHPALANVNLASYKPDKISQAAIDAMSNKSIGAWYSMTAVEQANYLSQILGSAATTGSNSANSNGSGDQAETYTAAVTDSGVTITGSKGDTITFSNTGSTSIYSWNTPSEGISGQDIFAADGSETGKITYANGSYATITDDGRGNQSIDYFTKAGSLMSATWQHSDGSSGTDALSDTGYAVSGSTEWGVYYEIETNPDGSYTIETGDNNNTISNAKYSEGGGLLSSAATPSSAVVQNAISKTSNAQVVDPDTGKLITVAVSTDSGGNNVHAAWVSNDGNGVADWYVDGAVILSNKYTDGSSDEFNLYSANGDSTLSTLISPFNALSSSRDVIAPLVNYDSQLESSFDYTHDHFGTDGSLQSDVWQLVDGTQGSSSFSSSGGTGSLTRVNGSVSSFTLDSQGDITVKNGNSVDWWHIDGTHGQTISGETYSYSSNGTLVITSSSGSAETVAAASALNPDNSTFSKIVNADQSYSIVYTDEYGDSQVFEFNSAGQISATNHSSIDRAPMTISGGQVNGTAGNSPSPNPGAVVVTDGTGTKTTYFLNASGHLTGEDWSKTDGSHGMITENADGSTDSTTYAADGSSVHTFDQGNGSKSQQHYAIDGTLASDIWTNTDGSGGDDAYSSDGSTLSHAHYSDGTSTSEYDDGKGDTSYNYFASDGTLIGSSLTLADGSTSIVSYDGGGKSEEVDTASDGSGKEIENDGAGTQIVIAFSAKHEVLSTTTTVTTTSQVSTTEIFQDGSQAIQVKYADGSQKISSKDIVGNSVLRVLNAAGALVSEQWTYANGTTGAEVFDADGVAHQTAGSTPVYNAGGVLQGDTWFAADGSKGTDTYTYNGDGSVTELTNTTYADGTTSIATDDGKGDVTTTFYGADAIETGDTWSRADGSHGTDTFGADGSATGTNAGSDGSKSDYVKTSSGQTTTTLHDSDGNLTEVDVTNASGTLISQTKYAADGSYATITADAVGDNTTTQYTSAGIALSDAWSDADGISGTDTFAADGGVVATKRYLDGSRDVTTSGSGELTSTIHYDMNGVAQWQATTQADGSVTRVALEPASSGTSAYDDFVKDGQYVELAGPDDSDVLAGSGFTYNILDASGNRTFQVDANSPASEYAYYDPYDHPTSFSGFHTLTHIVPHIEHTDLAAVTAYLADGTVVDLSGTNHGLSQISAQNDSDTIGFDGYGLNGALGGDSVTPEVPVRSSFGQAVSDADALAAAWVAANPAAAPAPAPDPGISIQDLSDTEVEAEWAGVPIPANVTLTHVLAHSTDAVVPTVATSTNNPDDPTEVDYWQLTTFLPAPPPAPAPPVTIVETNNLSYTYALSDGGSETDVYQVTVSSNGAASSPMLVSATATSPDGSSSTMDANGHLTQTFANGISISAPQYSETHGAQWTMTGADGSHLLTVNGSALLGDPSTIQMNFGGATVQVNNSVDPMAYWRSQPSASVPSSIPVPAGYNDVATITSGDKTVTLTFGSSDELLSETFTATDGSRGETDFAGDGSSHGEIDYADGNYTVTTGGADGSYRADNYAVDGTLTSDLWGDASGASGDDFFAADGSSTGKATQADGSYSLYTDDGHGDRVVSYFDASGNPIVPSSPPVESITTSTASDGTVTTYDTLTKVDGSFTQTWTATNGTSGTSYLDMTTGDGGGSSVSADGSDHETWETLYQANGVVETKSSSLDASGNGTTADSVKQADGSYVQTVTSTDGSQTTNRYDAATEVTAQVWSKSDGSSGTNFQNATTGESGGSSISADGSDHETWDTLYQANGAVETKSSSLDASGNGTTADSVKQADGSYVQTVTSTDGSQTTNSYDAATEVTAQVWSKSDGSSGTGLQNATTGEVGGSSISADGSDHETWDTLYLANGAVETKTSSLDASGNGTTADSVKQVDGSYVQTVTSTDGGQTTNSYDASTTIASQVWSKSDGSSGTNFQNATTGETGGSSISADGSDHETWDTLELANGATETKSSSLDATGNGTSFDTLKQADGSYDEQWSNSDGSTGSIAVGVDSSAGDTFTWGVGLQQSTLQTASGNDKLSIGEGVAPDQLWFSQNGSDLDITILGTNDQLDVQGWFSGPGSQLQSISLADGQTIAGSDIQKLVDAMASFSVPSSSQSQYTPAENTALQPLLTANWH